VLRATRTLEIVILFDAWRCAPFSSFPMSLPKLTSLSTQTLSLLLERQRLQTLSPSPRSAGLTQAPQITKNLTQLRAGIIELEENEGRTDAVTLLRSQFERMRSMLGDGGHVESLDAEDGSESSGPSSSLTHVQHAVASIGKSAKEFASSTAYTPYTDDPEEESDPNMMLQTQRQLMDEQDEHLDRLSHSINRQHHISLQMNDELDVHAGLLEELDTDLDNTDNRLRGARRRLDWFARAAKENSSAFMIAVLIVVLLILIIVFKT